MVENLSSICKVLGEISNMERNKDGRKEGRDGGEGRGRDGKGRRRK